MNIDPDLLKPEAAAAIEREIIRRRGFYEFVQRAWPVVNPGIDFVPGWHIELICRHLEAVTRGDCRRLIINVPPGASKPVSVDAMVLERVRGRIRLGDVAVGDEVLTHRGRFRRVVAVHEQGALPLISITTFRGRTVDAAVDHPFLTPRGWVAAGDLTERDALAVPTIQEHCGRATISHEAARLLGYLVGDGSCLGQPIMTTETEEIAADVERCSASLGFFTRRRAKEGNKSGSIIIKSSEGPRMIGRRGGIGPLRAWMNLHCLSGKSSYTKRVPASVMAGDIGVVRNFLGAYWCCDGFLSIKDISRSDVTIGCDTVSHGLAMDLQHLLYRLGVESRVRTKVAKLETASQPGGKYVSYSVMISDQDSAARFMAEVPMVHPKKLRGSELRRIDFDRSLRPDPVESIDRSRSGPCRCLTVEEDESFTANDIAVHNSTITSVMWPAWDWTLRPSRKWMAVSCEERLTGRDALACRRLVQSEWYQQRWGNLVRVDDSGATQMTQEIWNLTKGGRRYSTTVGGGAIGWHADIQLIDDPIKPKDMAGDPEVARNALERCWTWWTATMASRRTSDKFARVIIMQRLHELDLVGRILELDATAKDEEGAPAPEWTHLMLPMRFEKERGCVTKYGHDPRGADGELLCEARWNLRTVKELEREFGEQVAAAQLQQRPAPAGGNVFKREWFKSRWMPKDSPRWATLPSLLREHMVPLPTRFFSGCISVDCAFKDTAGADNVAITAWGEHAGKFYLLDSIADRMNLIDTIRCFLAMCARYPWARARLVEDKANGPAVEQAIRGKLSGLIMVNPEGGKFARANAVSPLCQAGDVVLPDESVGGWVTGFVEEIVTFPFARRDDQTDAMTQALTYMDTQTMGKYLQAMENVASGKVRLVSAE